MSGSDSVSVCCFVPTTWRRPFVCVHKTETCWCTQDIEELLPEVEESLKLLVSVVNIDNLKSLLWSLVYLGENEYRQKLHKVQYLMCMHINRDLVRESLQCFVLDIFNSPENRDYVCRAHDIYHNLMM